MAQSATQSRVRELTPTGRWSAAVTGGLAAGLAMGLLMQFVMGVMPVVGALYGQPTVLAGWVAHIVHSVVLAVVFAALVTSAPLDRYGRRTGSVVGMGLVYGAVLWLALAAVVMPVWLGFVGVTGVPVPNLNVTSLAAHLVYGGVLGGVYAAARVPATRSVEPASADAL